MLGGAGGAVPHGRRGRLWGLGRWLRLDGVGARRRGIWGGRVRYRRSTMVAAHAPADRGGGLRLRLRDGRHCWHCGHCGHWRHGWCSRRRVVLLVVLVVLLLRASHAPVARHFLRRRSRGRDSLGGHVVRVCCATMRCVPARVDVRDAAPMEVRGRSAGEQGNGRCTRIQRRRISWN